MRIDQRNSGAAVTINSLTAFYSTDRWAGRGKPAAGVFTLQQSSIAPPGFSNSLVATVTTAATPAAGDVYFIQERIEGFNIADLAQGSATASSFTLSFWTRSSVTGTHGGSVGNNVDRSYPFSFTINAANTWEYKTVTVSGCPDGTWNTTNGMGLLVHFSMGTTVKGAANAWGNYNYAPTGSVDLISTNGATLYITGVQLEAGPTATPFERRPYSVEESLCMRYAEKVTISGFSVAHGFDFNDARFPLVYSFKVRKRAASGPYTGASINGASSTNNDGTATPTFTGIVGGAGVDTVVFYANYGGQRPNLEHHQLAGTVVISAEL